MMRSLSRLGLVAMLLVVGCTRAAEREDSLARWSDLHPVAARELGFWVRTYPQAASQFFEWDGHHPGKSHQFVYWTISNPMQPLEAFVAMHPGWPYFAEIMETYRQATEEFMMWCRRNPQDAMALMNHYGALSWAGHHLYGADWHMETQQ
jgi:hypothetical protein